MPLRIGQFHGSLGHKRAVTAIVARNPAVASTAKPGNGDLPSHSETEAR